VGGGLCPPVMVRGEPVAVNGGRSRRERCLRTAVGDVSVAAHIIARPHMLKLEARSRAQRC